MVLFIYIKNIWHNLDGYIKKKNQKSVEYSKRYIAFYFWRPPCRSNEHRSRDQSGGGRVVSSGGGVVVVVVVRGLVVEVEGW